MANNKVAKKTVETLVDFDKVTDLTAIDGIFDLNDNIKGVTGRIPQIKILHQGQMFVMPDDSKVAKFEGIILHHSPANAWWETAFEDSSGDLPTCYSTDGFNSLTSDSKVKPQATSCGVCKHNQFGTDGRGKACKNMWRVHILIEGEELPKRLTLPPSNLVAIQDYLIMLRDKKIPHALVKTEFSLVKTKSKDGIDFSKIVFTPKSVITDKNAALNLKRIKNEFSAAFGENIEISEFGDKTNTEF